MLWPVKAIFEKRTATVEVGTLISPVLLNMHVQPSGIGNYLSYAAAVLEGFLLCRSRPGTNLVKRSVSHWVTRLHSLGSVEL